MAKPTSSSSGTRQPPALPEPVSSSTPNISSRMQSRATYAWLRTSLRMSTSACEAAGRITRNQKNAPKPTMKIVASSDSWIHGTRTAAARIMNSEASDSTA